MRRKKARRLAQDDMPYRRLIHRDRELFREHIDRHNRGGLCVLEHMGHLGAV